VGDYVFFGAGALIFLYKFHRQFMKRSLLLSVMMMLTTLCVTTHAQNIQIGGFAGEWPNEPSVGINPVNPDQIMIGANADNYYMSNDGGYTWSHGIITSSFGVNCDPVIVADQTGNFYYFHLVPDLSRVVCQKMTGFSGTWSDGSYTATYNTYDIDKEWAVADPMTGTLYTSWTRFNNWGSSSAQDSTDVFLARSTDGGATWSDQKLISNVGGNATGGFGSVHGSCPATGPNGEVYMTWWSPAGLMFDRSTDHGDTWLNTDINITGMPVQWIVTLPGIQTGVSFPILSCDRSGGPHHGTLYVNWTDKRSGNNDANIWISKSTDGGTSWSEPKKVNDDGPGKHQFFNNMTIDQVTGNIYVVFYDRRNYTDTRTDVYIAVSKDGGETFINQRISDTPFIPFSTVFFGHYISVAAHNNMVFATWMRMDEGQMSLWGTKINPFTVATGNEPVVPAILSQNTPNPFDEYTFFSFKLDKPSEVILEVRDNLGMTIITLIDHEIMGQGKHVIRFSPAAYKLSSGTYFYSLRTGNKTLMKKMIYFKGE
jgi:hypothetical protein